MRRRARGYTSCIIYECARGASPARASGRDECFPIFPYLRIFLCPHGLAQGDCRLVSPPPFPAATSMEEAERRCPGRRCCPACSLTYSLRALLFPTPSVPLSLSPSLRLSALTENAQFVRWEFFRDHRNTSLALVFSS